MLEAWSHRLGWWTQSSTDILIGRLRDDGTSSDFAPSSKLLVESESALRNCEIVQ